ncbi:MAG: two-component system, chemotaxis family, protein-glutamate methylesterase/glutaminase [Blastocatellia bacterium]|jgi:two-component system chemotaxis response regulator CheB|nr:two-component system, chemotaxis family, protein-glutamate methylesterase/glutaminase [Blastocatellia bacterium]
MDFDIVVVGTSTGGLKALQVLLSGLPADFPLPVVIVQHRAKGSDIGLRDYLQQSSHMPVIEPDDKEALLPGRVYLAPRDYHLLIENGALALSTAPPLAHARPSIDMLFETAADNYAERVIGVILTGANYDGAQGLSRIKARGGLTLVQDPLSAACPQMPAAALEATRADAVLPLDQMAARLQELTNPSRAQIAFETVYPGGNARN